MWFKVQKDTPIIPPPLCPSQQVGHVLGKNDRLRSDMFGELLQAANTIGDLRNCPVCCWLIFIVYHSLKSNIQRDVFVFDMWPCCYLCSHKVGAEQCDCNVSFRGTHPGFEQYMTPMDFLNAFWTVWKSLTEAMFSMNGFYQLFYQYQKNYVI
jgi:hypothetical protein